MTRFRFVWNVYFIKVNIPQKLNVSFVFQGELNNIFLYYFFIHIGFLMRTFSRLGMLRFSLDTGLMCADGIMLVLGHNRFVNFALCQKSIQFQSGNLFSSFYRQFSSAIKCQCRLFKMKGLSGFMGSRCQGRRSSLIKNHVVISVYRVVIKSIWLLVLC